jgi:4,5-dihydroxyphthalate decarboxylase
VAHPDPADPLSVSGAKVADLPISLTCADYARVMPLATGDVKPEGIALTLIHGSGGSWEMRAEMLRRALEDPTVQGGEASMAGHLRRLDKGDRRYIGLPVFPLRNFTARDLYVRKDGAVKQPADLISKRIGMYDWVASGSIWYRHFLRFIDVPPESLEWWIGDIDAPRPPTHLYTLPEGVHRPPAGRSLSEMLIAEEIDAIYSPSRPRHYDPVNGPIVRLFADIRTIERDYFRRTGCFPPQHLVILRRDIWRQNKWIAPSLTDAFIRCNDRFTAAQRNFPYVSPWLDIELEQTEALMGADFHPYGFDKNRETVDVFCRQAHELGIVGRLITAEEYFAEYLSSL